MKTISSRLANTIVALVSGHLELLKQSIAGDTSSCQNSPTSLLYISIHVLNRFCALPSAASEWKLRLAVKDCKSGIQVLGPLPILFFIFKIKPRQAAEWQTSC